MEENKVTQKINFERELTKDKKGVIMWIRTYKKELIISGVLVIVGGVLVIKNWDFIKKFFKSTKPVVFQASEVEPLMEKVVMPAIPSGILDNLSGNKLTATELGNKVWCSAQAINKRIVASGLATKLPCGEYSITDAGSLLGESTWKVTGAGHSFSNIEWDEKILEIIFSQEELLEIARKQECVKEILGREAA